VETSDLVLGVVSCSLYCAEGLHVCFLVRLTDFSVRVSETFSHFICLYLVAGGLWECEK
jgi:hypothetical protein